MKLKFFWFPYESYLIPSCECSAVNEHGISPIQQFLMDDGVVWATRNEYAAWFVEAVRKLDFVRSGGAPSEFLGREIMFADVGPDVVSLYSLPEDEAYEQIVKTDVFRSILVAWGRFVLTEPGVDSKAEIEIDDL